MCDTETRSAVDISAGTDLYSRACEVRIVTYAFSKCIDGVWHDEPVQLWEPWQDPATPADFAVAVANPDVIFVAHSAVFDRLALQRSLKIHIPLSRWRCTRSQAYTAGLPGSLELLGIVSGLEEADQKRAEDKHLIDLFCSPNGNGVYVEPWQTPEKWAAFTRYAMQDTHTLREIYKRLPQCNYQGLNLRAYHLDQIINERGFGFDARLAAAAVEFLKLAKTESDANMSALSAGEVHAATQRNRLLHYLREKHGLEIENLRASEVREWLEHDDLNPIARLLLEQRLEASKSSGSKYTRGLKVLGPGNRQRHTIQFNGAGRTGRDSGRGFQPQNLARPVLNVRREDGRIELSPVKADYIDSVIIPGIYSHAALCNPLVYGGPNEACALALRHVITAAPGNELVVADWKNIESRVLAWLAGEEWKLEAYRANDRGTGYDLYKLLFSQFFGTAIADVNDTERQSGKAAELGFGFGGGCGALVATAALYQMDLTPLADIVLPRATEAQKKKAYQMWRRAFISGNDFGLEPKVYQACDVLKQTYRESNGKINQLRHDIDAAVRNSIEAPNQIAYSVGRCKVWCTGKWLIIELPSGRRLMYASPRIEVTHEPDEDITVKKIHKRETVTYITARGKNWRREKAWSGLWLENIVQATAHDVLRWAKDRVHMDTLLVPEVLRYLQTLPENERTAISLCVHDEIVLDLPIGSYSPERLKKIMTAPFPWSDGLPLAADAWNFPRYGKREGK
jgi:DNA polymerase